jgi:hypothetical protein
MGVCGGVHAGALCLNWTLWPVVLSDWWGGPISVTCCRSWVGKRGRFGGRSLGPTFFFTYLDNNWSNVGLDLTNRPSSLNVLVFYIPISSRCGLKVCGRHGSLALPDRLLEWLGLSGEVPDRPRLCIGPSAMRRIGSRVRPPVCDCPPTFVMVTFRVSPPSGVFSATTFLREILLFSSAFRALPMMTSLPSPSVMSGRIRIFCPRSRSHSLGRAPCPPEISIVPH